METASEADLSQYVTAPLLERPEKPLAGKSALITGATRFNGIGFAIAEQFALEGASPLFLVGTENSRPRIPYLEQRLSMYGVKAHVLIGDVGSEESCISMMENAYQLAGGDVYILVNNAGANMDKAFTDTTVEDWTNITVPKARGAFLMTREWFRIRNESADNIRGGRVINIGSVVGLYGNYGQTPYEAANGALISLTKGWSLELARRGITVNLVAPTFVEGTDMSKDVDKNAIQAVIPIGEISTPHDVATSVAFLAGPDGAKYNGAIFIQDGGTGSSYTALAGLRRAGWRRVPGYAVAIAEDLTRDEVVMIRRSRGGVQNVPLV